ncbi:MAG TPA: hypothetical protein VGN08_02785 [Solirubrobacteraceae bacterium]|jgi:hypothetical protein
MPYDDVLQPPEIVAAFGADDSASTQASAAALLTLGWQLSDQAGREDVLAQDEASYLIDGLGGPPPARTPVPRDMARGVLDDVGAGIGDVERPSGAIRQRLIERYREQPSAALAAGLFEACLRHDDELVRVASASSYMEIATEVADLLEVLAGGTRSDELLVRDVAATALGRVAPEHPALDNPWQAEAGQASPSPLQTSLIVHGTFAKDASWWQPGGDFHTFILDDVWSDLYAKPDCFGWSGGYSQAARALAAEQLVAWIETREGRDVGILAHSHGGNVAMLATHAGISVGTLVLLSVPVHWSTYSPQFSQVARCVSFRVKMDLVILADFGGQRFEDPRISEHVLPIWFKHPATHEPATWQTYDLSQYL